MPAELPDQLTTGPFTGARAVDLGLTRAVLRGKRFGRVRRGVYVAGGSARSFVEQFQAARLVLPPDIIAVSVTGLRLYGVNVGDQFPLRFASAHPHPVRRAGIAVSRPKQLPVRSSRARFVASPEHCFVSAAGALNLLELVTAGDWLIRLKLTTRSRLINHAAASRGPGVRLGRRAASFVRDRVDSPRESKLRLCLMLAGLPTPDCNLTLGTDEWPIGQVDLAYPKFKVFSEEWSSLFESHAS